MDILFICTGNTCRSPMAEALATKAVNALAGNSGAVLNASSAGISVAYPSGAEKNAIDAMKKYGLDISGHKSREVTDSDIENACLILTMTKRHKEFLSGMSPEHKNKIFTIGEYTCDDVEISDPYGMSADTYVKCAEQLEALINKAIHKIMKERC